MRWEGLTPAVLHEYLDQCQTDFGTIHDCVAVQYFYRDEPDSLPLESVAAEKVPAAPVAHQYQKAISGPG
jgi:hypothetical protein